MKKGKRYAELTKLVDRANNYDPQEAVALVKKLAYPSWCRWTSGRPADPWSSCTSTRNW